MVLHVKIRQFLLCKNVIWFFSSIYTIAKLHILRLSIPYVHSLKHIFFNNTAYLENINWVILYFYQIISKFNDFYIENGVVRNNYQYYKFRKKWNLIFLKVKIVWFWHVIPFWKWQTLLFKMPYCPVYWVDPALSNSRSKGARRNSTQFY